MSCSKVRPLLSAFSDRELAEPSAVATHLLECAACRDRLAQLDRISDLLTAGGAASAPDRLWHRIASVASQRSRPARRPIMRQLAAAAVGGLLYVGSVWAMDAMPRGASRGSLGRSGPETTPMVELLADVHRSMSGRTEAVRDDDLDAAPEIRLVRQILGGKEDRR